MLTEIAAMLQKSILYFIDLDGFIYPLSG